METVPEVLLAVLGSAVLAPTVAVLFSVVALLGACPVTTITGAAETPSVESVQITSEPVRSQLSQPGPLTDKFVSAAGKVSLTTRLAAVLGPVLVTRMVYVKIPAASTGSGVSTLVIAKFAEAVTVVVSVSKSLAAFGSSAVVLTPAVLVRVVASAGAVTVMMIDGKAPTAALARVAVMRPEAWVIDQPVPEAPTNVSPAGKESVTVTLGATLGPALLTANV